MSDPRIPFSEAIHCFRDFLRDQEWSDDLLWLSRDRITGRQKRFWILRPDELVDPQTTELFYESIRRTRSSIRIDAFCSIGAKTLAYVEDYGGDSRRLNYGIHNGSVIIHTVSSRLPMALHSTLNSIRGVSPFLKNTAMTPSAELGGDGHRGRR